MNKKTPDGLCFRRLGYGLLKIAALILTFFLPNKGRAQEIEWLRPVLASSNNGIIPQCVYTDNSGILWTITNLTDKGIFDRDTIIPDSPSSVVLSRYDTSGRKLPFIVIRNPHTRFYVNAITIDPEKNIYLAGQFTNTITKENFIIAKCDSSGKILWLKPSRPDVVSQGVTLDNKGHIFLTGYIMYDFKYDSFTFNPIRSSWNSFISRLDTTGRMQWVKFFYGYGKVTEPMSHSHGCLLNNGALYVTGHFSGISHIDSFSLSGKGGILMKIDTSDRRVISLQKDTPNTSQKFYIYSDKNGNIYSTTTSEEGRTTKYNSQGSPVYLPDTFTLHSQVKVTSSGVNRDGQILTYYYSKSIQKYMLYLSSSEGIRQGEIEFPVPNTYIYRIVPDQRNQFYIYGKWYGIFAYKGDTLHKSGKPDSSGTFVGRITIPAPLATGIAGSIPLNEALSIFPNPNSGRFTLSLPEGIKSDIQLSIYNNYGVQVYQEMLPYSGAKIPRIQDLGRVAPGIYLLRCQYNGSIVARKFIIQ